MRIDAERRAGGIDPDLVRFRIAGFVARRATDVRSDIVDLACWSA